MDSNIELVMEAMLPELHDLKKRGIFTEGEVKTIAKMRRQHEYLLQGGQARKEDYIRCIQYEINLHSLRVKRKERMQLKRNSRGDSAGDSRIHTLFMRALRRFKGDRKLWLQYIDICLRTRSYRVLSKVFARALRVFPREDGLWVYAASCEYEHNHNMSAARSLLQRGLRINPASHRLWREYLRLECLYLGKLIEREKVLLGDEAETKSVLDPKLLAGAIPSVVFSNACKQFPEDVSFQVELAQVPGECGLPDIASRLLQSVLDTHPTSETVWRTKAAQAEGQAARQAVLEQALAANPCPQMWDLLIEHAVQSMEASVKGPHSPRQKQCASLAALLKRAHKAGQLSDGAAVMAVGGLLGAGAVAMAREWVRVAMEGRAHSSLPVSLVLACVHTELASSLPLTCPGPIAAGDATSAEWGDVLTPLVTMADALGTVDGAEGVWQALAPSLVAYTPSLHALGTALLPRVIAFPELLSHYLHYAHCVGGVALLQSEVGRLATNTHPHCPALAALPWPAILQCVEAERLAGDSKGAIREMLEYGVSRHGRTCVGLWVELARCELGWGEAKRAAEVYRRASTSLESPQAGAFQTQYMSLV